MLRNERGRGLIKIIIYLAVIAYIGLLVVRFASVSIKYKDLEVKIRESIRNQFDCNEEKLTGQIYNLLDERGITPIEEEIFVECRGNRAKVSFSYEDLLDGLFFKKKILKKIEIEGVIS
ncbi:MAG: hypothetical protein ACUVUG_08520 [Candidatus Aminicenantia bacterium]